MSNFSSGECSVVAGGALLVLFVGLKLGGVIHWSWWWMLSPVWLPAAFIGVVFMIGFAAVAAKWGR